MCRFIWVFVVGIYPEDNFSGRCSYGNSTGLQCHELHVTRTSTELTMDILIKYFCGKQKTRKELIGNMQATVLACLQDNWIL